MNRAEWLRRERLRADGEGFAAIPGGHFQLRRDSRPFLLIYDLEHGAGAACFSGGGSGAVLMDCADPDSFKRRVAPSLRRLGIAPGLGGSQPSGRRPPRRRRGGVGDISDPPGRAAGRAIAQPGVPRMAGRGTRGGHQDRSRRRISTELAHAGRCAPGNPPSPRIPARRTHLPTTASRFSASTGAAGNCSSPATPGWAPSSELLDAGTDVSADVIIAGRHRTDLTLSDPFLDAVNPRVIIASHSDFPIAEKLNPASVGLLAIPRHPGDRIKAKPAASPCAWMNREICGWRASSDKSVMTLKPR